MAGDRVSKDNQTEWGNDERDNEGRDPMLRLVDAVVAFSEIARESVGQRARDRPHDKNTDEAAKCPEAEGSRGKTIWRRGEEVGRKGGYRDHSVGIQGSECLFHEIIEQGRGTYPPNTTPYIIAAIKTPGTRSMGSGSQNS